MPSSPTRSLFPSSLIVKCKFTWNLFTNQVRPHLHGNIRPAAECSTPVACATQNWCVCIRPRNAVVAGRRRAIRSKMFVMLTRQKVIDAINEQIGYEFSASLQYYALAAHFAAEALPQVSQHFFRQADEEKDHALRFIKDVV